MGSEEPSQELSQSQARVPKLATLTVCIVPSAIDVWEQVTKARTQLKDPGLFRWPPHVNLLYPFIDIKSDEGLTVDAEIVSRLEAATKRVEPFTVTLEQFGTFGGKTRGILWLYPSSLAEDGSEPVHTLYQSLEQEFPVCAVGNRDFSPHMTLSHFESLQEAEAAQTEIEMWWPKEGLKFELNEVYLLQRKGDNGQFMRMASLRLGQHSAVQIHDPPLPFPDMPTVEEDWVLAERMKLKARRNGPRRSKKAAVPGENGPRRSKKAALPGENVSRRGPRRSTDTPAEIAAKRATRTAKRLEQEATQQAASEEL